MTHVLMQAVIDARNGVVMTVREAVSQGNTTRPGETMPKPVGSVLKQPTFNWKPPDKYKELCNFEIYVKNIFITYSYNILDSQIFQLL